ncbi:hypothetical protein BU26DRAFT_6432 [Trematosphaeria pertusa]|uniref:Uncharacterized protein n=1 Tax=Trematosphaeria pertusa TaxID=390896 RepID=A0A6A6J0M3_9PLEO|nr:uncharacterized protein BU26DRAFT_6432 [Trematosphaeria pertusa]KAF2255712.1 hypothetical protein BU26DRAFT_6432 [Trematosphaeria pertusa]
MKSGRGAEGRKAVEGAGRKDTKAAGLAETYLYVVEGCTRDSKTRQEHDWAVWVRRRRRLRAWEAAVCMFFRALSSGWQVGRANAGRGGRVEKQPTTGHRSARGSPRADGHRVHAKGREHLEITAPPESLGSHARSRPRTQSRSIAALLRAHSDRCGGDAALLDTRLPFHRSEKWLSAALGLTPTIQQTSRDLNTEETQEPQSSESVTAAFTTTAPPSAPALLPVRSSAGPWRSLNKPLSAD